LNTFAGRGRFAKAQASEELTQKPHHNCDIPGISQKGKAFIGDLNLVGLAFWEASRGIPQGEPHNQLALRHIGVSDVTFFIGEAEATTILVGRESVKILLPP